MTRSAEDRPEACATSAARRRRVDVSALREILDPVHAPTPGSLRISFASASRIESGLSPTLVTAVAVDRDDSLEEADGKAVAALARGSARSRHMIGGAMSVRAAVVCSRMARSSGYGATPWSDVNAKTIRVESRILYSESMNMPRYLSSRRI